MTTKITAWEAPPELRLLVQEHVVVERGDGILPSLLDDEVGIGVVSSSTTRQDVLLAWRRRYPTPEAAQPLLEELEAGREAILSACAALPDVPPGRLVDPDGLAAVTSPVRASIGYWTRAWRAVSSLVSVIGMKSEIPPLDPEDARLGRFNSLRTRLWHRGEKYRGWKADYDAQPAQLERRQSHMRSKRADPAYREAENRRARERRAAKRGAT